MTCVSFLIAHPVERAGIAATDAGVRLFIAVFGAVAEGAIVSAVNRSAGLAIKHRVADFTAVAVHSIRTGIVVRIMYTGVGGFVTGINGTDHIIIAVNRRPGLAYSRAVTGFGAVAVDLVGTGAAGICEDAVVSSSRRLSYCRHRTAPHRTALHHRTHRVLPGRRHRFPHCIVHPLRRDRRC